MVIQLRTAPRPERGLLEHTPPPRAQARPDRRRHWPRSRSRPGCCTECGNSRNALAPAADGHRGTRPMGRDLAYQITTHSFDAIAPHLGVPNGQKVKTL